MIPEIAILFIYYFPQLSMEKKLTGPEFGLEILHNLGQLWIDKPGNLQNKSI